MNIVCRLGGFHTLMSFLGSIGSVMKGSGLEEALENAYGPTAITHMMFGKAASRALHGHFLVEAALVNKLMYCHTQLMKMRLSTLVRNQKLQMKKMLIYQVIYWDCNNFCWNYYVGRNPCR